MTVVTAVFAGCVTLLIFGGIGGFFYWAVRRSQKIQKAAQSWPTTTGTVLKSYVNVSTDANHSTSHDPKIIYEFTVNGQLYRGDRYRVGIYVARGGYLAAQEIVDRYPEGSQVTVYYNPQNPAECTLVR